MSLLQNFTDLANSIKLALDRKADKSEIPVVPTIPVNAVTYKGVSVVNANKVAVIPDYSITIVPTFTTLSSGTFSKTNAEIVAAIDSGKTILLDMADALYAKVYNTLIKLDYSTSGNTYPNIEFYYSYFDGDGFPVQNKFVIDGTSETNAFTISSVKANTIFNQGSTNGEGVKWNNTTHRYEASGYVPESNGNKLLSVSGGGAGITSAATDNQYPSAKAVYDYVDTLVGNADALLGSGVIS